MAQKRFYGYVVAAVSFIVMFINIGSIGTIGVFMPAMAADTGQSVGNISIVVSTATIVAFVVSLGAGKLIKKIGPKNTVTVSLLCNALHFAIYAVSNANIPILIFGSLFSGTALSLGGQGCTGPLISQWFIRKRASVLGFVFGAAAFGSAIFLLICGVLIARWDWVVANWVLTGMLLVVALPLNLFLIRSPEQKKQKPLGWEDEEKILAETAAKTAGKTPVAEIDFKGARSSASFWMLMIAMVMLGMMPAGFKTFAPAFWQHGGMDALVSSQYITVYMIIATVATMLSGTIADRFGNYVFVTYLHIFFIIGMGVVVYSASGLATSFVILSILLVGISYPLYGSIPATVVPFAFGRKAYSEIVTMMMGMFYLGLALVSPLVRFVLDRTGSYVPAFTFIGALGFFSAALILIALKISPANKARAQQTASADNSPQQA